MSDQLHQMTVEYQTNEDRILFRVVTKGHTEFRVWLTRRVVASLWKPVIETFAAQPDIQAQAAAPVKQAVMSIKHQQVVQNSDFTQKHDPEARPAATNVTPMLAVAVECVEQDKGQIRLTFKTSENRDVNLNINQEMLHAFCHLVRQAVDRAAWGVDVQIGDATFAVAEKTEQIH
jgi:hypothetical protein